MLKQKLLKQLSEDDAAEKATGKTQRLKWYLFWERWSETL
jgi:hypothetical protein